MLFLLQVLLDAALDPDDAAEQDQGHRRKDDKTVVHVAGGIEGLRNDTEAEQGAASKKFAEEGDDYKDETVTCTVCKTVKQ